MSQDATSPINFSRDEAWIEQLKAGEVLSEAEGLALWQDMLATFFLAKSFRDTMESLQQQHLAMVDAVAGLVAENERLRTEYGALQEKLDWLLQERLT